MTLKRKGRKMKLIYAHKIKINANNYGDSTGKPHQIDTSLEARFMVSHCLLRKNVELNEI